jgi:hypothetical protein
MASGRTLFTSVVLSGVRITRFFARQGDLVYPVSES